MEDTEVKRPLTACKYPEAVRFVPEALVKEKVVMVPMFIVPEAAFSSDDDTTPRLDTCR